MDLENRKRGELAMLRDSFRQKFLSENTKKIELKFSNIRSYTVPNNFEVVEKTGGIRQKGSSIEVVFCLMCTVPDYVVIKPIDNYPIPYPSDSELLNGKDTTSSKKAKIVEVKGGNQKNNQSGTHSFNIEFWNRSPSKDTFVFEGGGRSEGNRVSPDGPIRIVSKSCLNVYISVDDLPPYKICDNKTWTIQSGQVWKIVNNENYSVYSKNTRVSSFN